MVNTPFGIFGGPIPSASLPPAASLPGGTRAFTSDLGELVVQGVSWVPANGIVLKNRIALIGDSITQFSLFYTNVPTTAGSFVVSNGIGTLTYGSNTSIYTGNYFSLNNVSDPTLTHPDNGRFLQALSGSTGTTASTVVTFASSAVNGDYSNYLSGVWNTAPVIQASETGLASWLNAVSRGQYLVTANYAAVGETSAFTLAKVQQRVTQGIPFDIALLAVDGINDFNTVSPIGSAITASNTAVANYIKCIQTLQGAGYRVWIQLPPPNQSTGGSGAQANTVCANIVRTGLLNYAAKNSQLVVFDTFREMIAGQATASPFFAANSVGAMTSDGTHPNANAYCSMIRNLRSGSLAEPYWLDLLAPSIEPQSVTTLDDAVTFAQAGATYANLQQSSGLSGTAGTLFTSSPTPTGSAATNWGLKGNGGATSVTGTGGFTPTQLGSSNSANYGFAQRIQCATSAASQGFTFQGSANPSKIVAGNWYRAGIRVYVRANTSGLGSLWGNFLPGPTNMTFFGNGGFDVGYQLNAGEVYWLTTGPMFYSVTPSNALLSINYSSAGAGSVDLEISAPFIRQIDNPYL